MTINPQIAEALKTVKVYRADGLSYLLSVYYDIVPTYIPATLPAKMQIANILMWDESTHSVTWLIPLFEEQTTNFEWVTSWVLKFKEKNKDRRGNTKTAVARMKKFFAENPDVRQHEVEEATDLYLRSTQADYIQTSHYFISKGIGNDRTEGLLEWVQRYREENRERPVTNDVTNRMQ